MAINTAIVQLKKITLQPLLLHLSSRNCFPNHSFISRGALITRRDTIQLNVQKFKFRSYADGTCNSIAWYSYPNWEFDWISQFKKFEKKKPNRLTKHSVHTPHTHSQSPHGGTRRAPTWPISTDTIIYGIMWPTCTPKPVTDASCCCSADQATAML